MDLREQLYMTCIAECGTLSRAAEKLHISQPALSAFLSKIESRLGVKLFERSARTVTPTPIGRIYLEKAAAIIRLGYEFDVELSRSRSLSDVPIKIGLQMLRASRLSPRLGQRFRALEPDLRVEFAEGKDRALKTMLSEGGIDFAITSEFDGLKRDGFCAALLRNDTLFLAASEDDTAISSVAREANGKMTVHPRDVMDHVFLMLPVEFSMRRIVDKYLSSEKVKPLKAKEVSRHETALQMAAFGEGIAFTLDSFLPYFQITGRIRYYDVDGAPAIRYSAMYRKDHFPEPLLKRILRVLRNAFKEIV